MIGLASAELGRMTTMNTRGREGTDRVDGAENTMISFGHKRERELRWDGGCHGCEHPEPELQISR